jgi:hypothetical protein
LLINFFDYERHNDYHGPYRGVFLQPGSTTKLEYRAT